MSISTTPLGRLWKRFRNASAPAAPRSDGAVTRTSDGNFRAQFISVNHRNCIEVADSAHQAFDVRAARIKGSVTVRGQSREVACSAGCSHCCNLYVSATASELLLIEGYIRALPTAEQDTIRMRVQIAARHAQGKSIAQRDSRRVRCPFLSAQGMCDIYPIRPLTCRAYISFDLPACAYDFQHPGKGTVVTRSGSLESIRNDMLTQLHTKERASGGVGGNFELIQAMHILLNSDAHVADLADGKNVIYQAMCH
ncbi:hypothetical protein HDE80_004002 [Rhodanobacter sp. A1T4]|nr:hypothetical protein [Rhodanobacter sp. A1T4]